MGIAGHTSLYFLSSRATPLTHSTPSQHETLYSESMLNAGGRELLLKSVKFRIRDQRIRVMGVKDIPADLEHLSSNEHGGTIYAEQSTVDVRIVRIYLNR